MSAPVLLLSGVTREHRQGSSVVHALRGIVEMLDDGQRDERRK